MFGTKRWSCGATALLLFRADQDLIWIIDEGGRSYRELGPKDIEARGAAMPGGAPASP